MRPHSKPEHLPDRIAHQCDSNPRPYHRNSDLEPEHFPDRIAHQCDSNPWPYHRNSDREPEHFPDLEPEHLANHRHSDRVTLHIRADRCADILTVDLAHNGEPDHCSHGRSIGTAVGVTVGVTDHLAVRILPRFLGAILRHPRYPHSAIRCRLTYMRMGGKGGGSFGGMSIQLHAHMNARTHRPSPLPMPAVHTHLRFAVVFWPLS